MTAAFKKLTPILIVDAIEPCLPFWTGKLGFELAMSVPGEDGRLAFALLTRDGLELMYQSRAATGGAPAGPSAVLYFDVQDLDAIEQALQGEPVVKPVHLTPHGSTEFYVREPGGHSVGFAEFKAG